MSDAPARTDPRVTRSRAAVLAAALDLLAERGVAGTTVEAVAERSGVAKTTVYRQWPDRVALVRDAFTSALVPYAAPDTGTLRGDLVALVHGLAGALSSGPAAALMLGMLDVAEREPAFAQLHEAEAAARHRVVLEVVDRGVRRGELPSGTDPRLVLDVLAGAVLHRRWFGREPVDRAFCEAVVDVLLAGAPGPGPVDDGIAPPRHYPDAPQLS